MKGSRLKIRAMIMAVITLLSILSLGILGTTVKAATFTPSGAWTACPVASGSMANTIDEPGVTNPTTKVTLTENEGTTCSMSWWWTTPQDLTKFEMYCYGWADLTQTHIHSVWKKTTPYVSGEPWGGMVCLHTIETACPSNTWTDILHGYNPTNCYGIGIIVWINEDFWYNPEIKEVRATGNDPPNQPSNPSPASGATGVLINADLSWSGGDPNSGDTVVYDVYFGTSSSPPKVSDHQSSASYDPGTMSYNTMYYWKIVAWDNHGASTIGSIWHFTTEIQPPQLSYSPSTINFGTHDQGWTGSSTFQIWNSGSGTLTYTLSESLNWITVSPTSGSSTGEHDTITVSVVNTGSMSGYYSGTISISSNGGSGSVSVDITINPPAQPCLSSSPSTINFGTHTQGWTGSSTFEIWNSGAGTLTYTLSESISWITINPTSGSSTGEHDTITVSVSNTGSMSGYYSGTISISSNGGSGSVSVDITINPPSPVLSCSTTALNFGTHTQGWTGSGTFEIWNSGTGTLSYTLSESLSWITVSPTSGSSTGEHDTITVSVVNTGGMEGPYSGTISVTSNGGNVGISVYVEIQEGPNNAPYTPSNPNPGNNSNTIPVVATLSWSGGDPDGDTVTYNLYISVCLQPDFFSPYAEDITTDEYFIWLSVGQTYYWKVVATDEHGAQSASPIWTFSTKSSNQVDPVENTPPNKPATPSISLLFFHVHDVCVYTTTVVDPNGDNVNLYWDFDEDNMVDFELLNVTSGVSHSVLYIWDKPAGVYDVRVIATDIFGNCSVWSDLKTVYVSAALNNLPPSTPSPPAGDSIVYVNQPCTFTAISYDPNGDNIKYQWDFNSYPTSWDAVSWVPSGTLGSYTWTFDYETSDPVPVRVRTKDINGVISDWSNPAYIMIVTKKTSTIFNRNDFCGFTYGDVFDNFPGQGRLMYANGTTGAIVTGAYGGFPAGNAWSTACQGVQFYVGRTKTLTIDAEICYIGGKEGIPPADPTLWKEIKVGDPYHPDYQYSEKIQGNIGSVEDLQAFSAVAIGLLKNGVYQPSGPLRFQSLYETTVWTERYLKFFSYDEQAADQLLNMLNEYSRMDPIAKQRYQMLWGDVFDGISFPIKVGETASENTQNVMVQQSYAGEPIATLLPLMLILQISLELWTLYHIMTHWQVDTLLKQFENSGKAHTIHVTKEFTFSPGDHAVWAGLQSEVDNALLIFFGFAYAAGMVKSITIDGIAPPNIPYLRWPDKIHVGNIAFEASGVDQNGDPLQYFIDWGDGTTTTTPPGNPSNTWVSVPHRYNAAKSYTITIKSTDCDGMESPVNTYHLPVPLTKQSSHPSPFLNFLENHPNMFPLLQKLLQRLRQ